MPVRRFLPAVLILVSALLGLPVIADDGIQSQVAQLKRDAVAALKDEDYSRAISVMEEAAKLDPNDFNIRALSGKAYFETDRFQEAVREFEEADRLRGGAPWQSDAPCMCGFAYKRLNNATKAVAWLKSCLIESKNPIQLALARAALESMGDAGKGPEPPSKQEAPLAVSTGGEESSSETRYPGGVISQMQDALKAKKPSIAISMGEEYTRQRPYNPAVVAFLGRAYYDAGKYADAIKEFELIKQQQHGQPFDPESPAYKLRVPCMCGAAYSLLNDRPRAISWLKECVNMLADGKQRKYFEDRIALLQKQDTTEIADDPDRDNYLATTAFKGQYSLWSRKTLPIKVYVPEAKDAKGMEERFRRIFLQSLDTWMNALQGKLAYEVTPHASNANIVCKWVADASHFKGRFDAAITTFDQQVQWSPSSYQGANIAEFANGVVSLHKATIEIPILDDKGKVQAESNIAKMTLHELGHALGLRGHSPNHADTMSPFLDEHNSASLTDRDINTIRLLYGKYPVYAAASNTAVGTGLQR